MNYFTFIRPSALVLTLATSPLLMALVALPLPSKAESAPAPSPAASPMSVRSYTTKAGDRLDRIIQSTMPNSPLKIEVLRKAFIELNPSAFPAGKAGRMLKGAVLQIPDVNKLLSSIAAPASHESAANSRSMPMAGDFEERRRWIRYP